MWIVYANIVPFILGSWTSKDTGTQMGVLEILAYREITTFGAAY